MPNAVADTIANASPLTSRDVEADLGVSSVNAAMSHDTRETQVICQRGLDS